MSDSIRSRRVLNTYKRIKREGKADKIQHDIARQKFYLQHHMERRKKRGKHGK